MAANNCDASTEQFALLSRESSDVQQSNLGGISTQSTVNPHVGHLTTSCDSQEEKDESVDGRLSSYSAPYPSSIGDSTVELRTMVFGSICSYFQGSTSGDGYIEICSHV